MNGLLFGQWKGAKGAMKKAYPVFIKRSGTDFLVYVPDLAIYTQGEDFPNAIEMARDAIGLKGVSLEDDRAAMPDASNSAMALKRAKEDADEDFDFSDGILTYVDVDFAAYRMRLRNRAVKKNCTIPYWMSVEADKAGINYSRLLQDAIANALGLNKANM